MIAQKDPSSEIDFSLSYPLQSGANDFWLVVDISQNANQNDVVDFDLTQIKIDEISFGLAISIMMMIIQTLMMKDTLKLQT